jgi:rhamnosyltransferase
MKPSLSLELSVCAVIVTYHPNAGMLENMAKVLTQVQNLVVVDNGSTAEELAPWREASKAGGFFLIENGENLGIAEALNQGVLWAKNQGYPWVILFDQDSKITENFVPQMFEAWESHPDRDRVGTIQPRYVQPDLGFEPEVLRAADGGPVTSMTSGSLMPIWIFEKIGYFASDFFIDLVDCEYSLRIRAAGYSIADSRSAVLLHAAGNPEKSSFLGFSFQPSHHDAIRRYYISRNRVVVYRRYLFVFPRWILGSMYQSLRETAKCFVAEQDRARKFRNFLLGIWDGLTGRMGKREGL